MVRSMRHFRNGELPSMGPSQTLVAAHALSFADADGVLWYVNPFNVFVLRTYSVCHPHHIKIRKSGLASLAMFYYDFREEQKKDLRGLLSSVLLH